MLRHLLDVHEEEESEWDSIEFGMRILKSTRTAFERQILESVLIQKSRHHKIMNNKAEYNRCALPRLTAKLGEKDLDRWREGDRLEMEKEASIEEKKRLRKKEKSKRRGEGNRRMEQEQPKRKIRRVEGSEMAEAQNDEAETIPTPNQTIRIETPKKRNDRGKGLDKPAKKTRYNMSIKRYISCKKWREEDREDERRESNHNHQGAGEDEIQPVESPDNTTTTTVEQEEAQHACHDAQTYILGITRWDCSK